jgi:hypothetical protein
VATGLPWVRVDSDLAQNPKILDLIAENGQRGMAAAFMFVCSIGYSAAHNTDGSIRKAALASIHGTPVLARLLVDSGLWEPFEKGWQITKYAEHQPTMAMREAIEKAKSEAGRKAANARWGNDA